MYSQCVISVLVAQYITATGHTKVLHVLKVLLSAITLVFSEPLMTSNRCLVECFVAHKIDPGPIVKMRYLRLQKHSMKSLLVDYTQIFGTIRA